MQMSFLQIWLYSLQFPLPTWSSTANDAPARLDRKVAFCEVEEEGEEEVDVVVIVVVDSELIRKDEFSRKFVAI